MGYVDAETALATASPEQRDEAGALVKLIWEYEETLKGLDINADKDKIIEALKDNHEWTEDTARHIFALVEGWGCFLLRSALAIAIVSRVEDGSRT